MAFVVLVILAALWAVVLLPPLLRSRAQRANDSIGDFNHRLDVLGRTNGALRPGMAPRSTPGQRAAKRRRDVVLTLLLATGVSGLVALGTGASVAWLAFGLSLAAFAAFGALFAYARSIEMERAAKVRRMPQRAHHDVPLRRAASS